MSDHLYSSSSSSAWAPSGTAAPTCRGLVYVVPGMRLITQEKTMSCWLACSDMLLKWRIQTTGSPGGYPAEAKDSLYVYWKYEMNLGIKNAEMIRVASKLGFGTIPPMSPTPQAISGWLRKHGPLMCDGYRHVTVIAGIRDWSGSTELLVYDPDRPHETAGSWRDLHDWYYWDRFSGRDTQKNLQAIFYYAL